MLNLVLRPLPEIDIPSPLYLIPLVCNILLLSQVSVAGGDIHNHHGSF